MSVVLATGGMDHKIRFWDAPSGMCTKMIKFPDSQVNKIEITPDKQFIAAAGNPVIRLYEISSSSSGAGGGGGAGNPATAHHHHHADSAQQQPVLTLEGHTNNVTAVGFQKKGRYLYSSSEDGTVKIWDLRNPSYSRSFSAGGAVNSVCLRQDRDEFISGDQNGYVKVWDLRGNGCINSVKPSAGPAAATGSSGKDAASVSSAKSQKAVRYVDQQGVVPIQTVDISEDSRTLVAISNHGMVFVWDPSRGGLGGQTHAHHIPGGGHRNSPNHHNLGNDEGDDDVVAVTDPRDYPSTMDTAPNTPATEEEDVSTAAIDANGQSSLLKTITKFRAHAPGFYCLYGKISPDCRQLVTTGSDGTAKLWDTTTWELTDTLQNDMWVWDAAYCADSSYLVTASSDKSARLWNLRRGACSIVRKYHGHLSAVTCVALNDSSV